MTLSAVLDTTLLSNFAHVQRPDLLRLALGEAAATTPAVIAELRTGEAQGLVPVCDWSLIAVLELSEDERRLMADFSRQLNRGEAECIAVAVMRPCKFLSDDFAARRLAALRGVKVSGTLGVLLRLVAQNHLTLEQADVILNALISYGYRSPLKSLQPLLP